MKQTLKRLVHRLLRPGLQDVLHAAERAAAAAHEARDASLAAGEAARSLHQPVLDTHSRLSSAAHVGAVWRGGLSGAACLADGTPLPDLTRKYRDELAFWVRVSRDPEQFPSWTGTFKGVYGGWQQDRNDELAAWLDLSPDQYRRWAADIRALEIGSGPYPFLGRDRWAWALAVDPLAEGYLAEGLVPEECRHVAFLSASGERIPLPASCCDLIVVENCLDHVDDPAAVLTEMHRLLRPGGLVWLLVDLMDYKDEMHPNPFNEQRLREALANAGFVVVKERLSRENRSHPHAYAEFRALLVRDHPGGPRRPSKRWGSTVIPALDPQAAASPAGSSESPAC